MNDMSTDFTSRGMTNPEGNYATRPSLTYGASPNYHPSYDGYASKYPSQLPPNYHPSYNGYASKYATQLPPNYHPSYDWYAINYPTQLLPNYHPSYNK